METPARIEGEVVDVRRAPSGTGFDLLLRTEAGALHTVTASRQQVLDLLMQSGMSAEEAEAIVELKETCS